MNDESASNYLRDLGPLIVELARQAAKLRDANASSGEKQYYIGRLMAFHEVISLLQQQAELFSLPLDELGLDDIDPERDLL